MCKRHVLQYKQKTEFVLLTANEHSTRFKSEREYVLANRCTFTQSIRFLKIIEM